MPENFTHVHLLKELMVKCQMLYEGFSNPFSSKPVEPTDASEKVNKNKKKSSCYFGDFNVNGVTNSASISIRIASIRNQLDVKREEKNQ